AVHDLGWSSLPPVTGRTMEAIVCDLSPRFLDLHVEVVFVVAVGAGRCADELATQAPGSLVRPRQRSLHARFPRHQGYGADLARGPEGQICLPDPQRKPRADCKTLSQAVVGRAKTMRPIENAMATDSLRDDGWRE